MNNFVYKLMALFLVLICGFWTFSVAIHDILYPINNMEFIAYVLKGDGTNASFSITNKLTITIIFYTAVIYESLITVIILIAGMQMALNFRNEKFYNALNLAALGFAAGLFKYFVFFVTICTEWFYMWKTSENSQIKGILFSIFFLIGILFLNVVKRPERS